ncbi:bifunctional DNA-formamidopyrimidine glycosylase/DNA-(apurinic or apyrimidinic site) lyase [Flexibacterium corallicola]|uniref:bifunctional DNA-formamidopyrimidine glycosylase/DNA-(apurinic or apyrimidinic site) lyase n=1 Tax=Flexibacterium corallicola TaxID=3037259 RepID=UPI00286EC041|nr:bifunctional DNA-formamidopyrimidine glycosylase/DNA-(apurinic or apyrimidinic site) lyase [Pseudovibrio sp. M1P-2-3]
MPELPEVETVKTGLAPYFENATFSEVEVRRPNLRFPFPENFRENILGKQVTNMGRRSKYLLVDLSSGDVLVMHLGMSGSFRIIELDSSGKPVNDADEHSKLPQHDHVVFHLTPVKAGQGTPAKVIYNDPRRFGFMTLIPREALETHALFAKMGIEPLGNQLSGPFLQSLFSGKKSNLKSSLLNQQLIAGLGNIYVCEALWRSKLDPQRASSTVADNAEQAEVLVANIRAVLQDAIAAGGSTLKDHVQADGSLGYFQHSFAVYGREGEACRTEGCTGQVARIVQSGRSTFYCPECQH